jgi:hypothetical protein
MLEKELYKRIDELEKENQDLRAVNQQLREALGLQVEELNIQKQECKPTENENTPAETLFPFNKFSKPNEKIKLFMSLFRGRTDVYAKRCYSKNHDSSYYMPACKNEWVYGVCERPRVKCKNCSKRELLPVTEAVIEHHLRNRDENGNGVVGIYPLLPDETCLFLAVDFDGENWQKDVTAFREACRKLKIPAAIERSRSGNGAHVWFFFDKPVLAVSARKFGNVLLTKAMSIRHELRFTSYDRMFPNQDFH